MATLVQEVARKVTRDIGRDAGERLSPSKASLIGEFLKEDGQRRAKAGRPLGLAAGR